MTYIAVFLAGSFVGGFVRAAYPDVKSWWYKKWSY